jgi:hypothetical protein
MPNPDPPDQNFSELVRLILSKRRKEQLTGMPLWPANSKRLHIVWIPDDGDQDSETMSIKITK